VYHTDAINRWRYVTYASKIRASAILVLMIEGNDDQSFGIVFASIFLNNIQTVPDFQDLQYCDLKNVYFSFSTKKIMLKM
jgi:hypothetical protein